PSLPLHFLRTTPTPPTTPPFPYTTLFRSRARGFKGMKMKVGRNPSTQTHRRELIGNAEFCEVEPSEDLARVAAVRDALGPKGKLMVDVNCAWSPAMAIQMAREMERYNLYWIEEPVATD